MRGGAAFSSRGWAAENRETGGWQTLREFSETSLSQAARMAEPDCAAVESDHGKTTPMVALHATSSRPGNRHLTQLAPFILFPTADFRMNLVERFFRDLTVDCVRDGSFTSVEDLIKAMEAYLAERDLNPVRYQWKAEGAAVLEKIQRARAALAKVERNV